MCVSVYMITYTLYVHSLICSIYYCIISAILDVINIVITIVSIIVIIVFSGRQRVLRMKDQGVGSPHLLHTFSPQPASRPLFAVFGRIWRSLVAT